MAAPMVHSWKKYLIQFAHHHNDFRTAELEALIGLCDIGIRWRKADIEEHNPFLVVEIQSESEVRKIAGRSILIKNIIELWGQAKTYPELRESLKRTSTHIMTPYFSKDISFKFELESFNKKLKQAYKLSRFQELPEDVLAFQGDVKLNDPEETFFLVEDYSPFGSAAPENPLNIYFGRQICEGQRDEIRKFDLKDRKFIANTSMDAGLSLLMANIAKVTNNHLVIDPFVGTGSLLVACAHHGAYVMGTDINYLLLHAKGKPSRAKQEKRACDESIQANLHQYGLGQYYVDAVVGDTSKHNMWRQQPIFDAIITDPPYGVREKAKKVGTDVEDVRLSSDQKINHVPHKVDYNLGQIFKDLLDFAAKFLRIGGRLVFWFPVYRREYREENIPTHPCLQRVANCEQVLNCRVSRRLITMDKVREFQKIHESDNAQMEVDHYGEASFRQMYFHTRQGDNSGDPVDNGKVCQRDVLSDKMAAASLTDNG